MAAYMKQVTMFDQEESGSSKYTPATGSPIYVPKGRKPHLAELVDKTRAHALLRDIDRSNLPIEEKQFLVAAAQRHLVFNYELIADYYANASPEMQRLMEASALVIVDLDDAIELGYVRLCETIRKLYLEQQASDA